MDTSDLLLLEAVGDGLLSVPPLGSLGPPLLASEWAAVCNLHVAGSGGVLGEVRGDTQVLMLLSEAESLRGPKATGGRGLFSCPHLGALRSSSPCSALCSRCDTTLENILEGFCGDPKSFLESVLALLLATGASLPTLLLPFMLSLLCLGPNRAFWLLLDCASTEFFPGESWFIGLCFREGGLLSMAVSAFLGVKHNPRFWASGSSSARPGPGGPGPLVLEQAGPGFLALPRGPWSKSSGSGPSEMCRSIPSKVPSPPQEPRAPMSAPAMSWC